MFNFISSIKPGYSSGTSLSSVVCTVADSEHLPCFGVHLMESLPLGFELCNGEHLATWKAVEPLFWFFSFPHAKSEKCLLIIEFIYPRSLEIKENDVPEFASVLSESWTTKKVVLAICSLHCWLLLQCWHLYFLAKEGYTQAFMLIA